MRNYIEKLFKEIIKSNTEQFVHDEVDNAKFDFVNEDWENEFDDIFEAYEEQGRGEAESQVLNDLITVNDLTNDDYCDLFNELAEFYYLTTN